MPEKSDSAADKNIRILVVQTAFLGDIILTTPLLLALKAAHPDSFLALLTTPVGAEALRGLPELDELIVYDKKGRDRGAGEFFKIISNLRAKKFDLAISPHRSFRTALVLALSGIRVLVGFEDAALSRIYHFRIKRQKGMHDVERNLALLGPVAELPSNYQPRLKLPVPVDFDLAKLGIAAGPGPLIGLAPGSAWPTKRWPARNFAGLASMLAGKLGAKIILLGDKNDAGVCEEVAKADGEAVVNLAGRTSLQELFGIISKLDALVSNDSAPVHVGSAFGIPTVAIFGPTVPGFGFGPWGNPHKIIGRELACRPCHHHGPVECPEGHFKCMNEVSSEEVAAAVTELLKNRNEKVR